MATQNLAYIVPTDLPRTQQHVTKTGTVVHDLRKLYTPWLIDGALRGVELEQAARDMWEVVVQHRPPNKDALPFYDL